MRLNKARIRKYRSIVDSGEFNVEAMKTILVGPNEAGKSALLQALQQLNAPPGTPGFHALRDYPRSLYNTDIVRGRASPNDITVVEAEFGLEEKERAQIPDEFKDCTLTAGRTLGNTSWYRLNGGPSDPQFGDIRTALEKLASFAASHIAGGEDFGSLPAHLTLASITDQSTEATLLDAKSAEALDSWLAPIGSFISESQPEEKALLEDTRKVISRVGQRQKVIEILSSQIPVFVLFNNYFRVKPLIHLGHLADRTEKQLLDDAQYDYGNNCLLKLLGFTARQLSDLGKAPDPDPADELALQKYRDQLDNRAYQLNAASVDLTKAIREIWVPGENKAEADKLRIRVDQQYLKVVVEDELGVEIEFDQRSEGFQWLVSFFVVFFAEATGRHVNAILLLDEPGLSLHGLKQREFRRTISGLAKSNQTIYTTHSPFLVGPEELDIVRVVELTDRKKGTVVRSQIMAEDPAALLPLQEALAHDLAQSLFAQQRNLVLEGLIDLFYLEATADLLRAEYVADLDSNIALIPATSAGMVAYYATILHARKLKVAALLDSDSAGEETAKQAVLAHTLGSKGIVRTKDAYTGSAMRVEIEDLLRNTLVNLAKSEFGWDITAAAAEQPNRQIVEIFKSEIRDFSKYKLAKAYVRWTRGHTSSDLSIAERVQWTTLIEKINACFD
jgi:hypothetical protein